ncbi:UDP-glucuronosyl UDP-glucosyltransferase domain containing protein [Trichostrongylus colubriformis]|uniref:glucuronosyltransferase n=1 Tax=Trichostrongylus colubriformis TaxID=6319 RepID=A0AAN8ISF6_TRICO
MPEHAKKKFDRKEMRLWTVASKSIMSRLEIVMFFSNLQKELCECKSFLDQQYTNLVGDNKTMSLLRDEHFDVGISEVIAPCGFGIFELINIPNMIGASAVGVVDSMNEFVEVPVMPSFMPSLPEATPLDEKFRLMMDRPDREGVVLISFGTYAPTVQMPNIIRSAILEAVSTFQNYTFIWKIDEDDKVPEMANLFTHRWIPQASLLRHPNLRCFISHAGLNSVLELTRNGKPAILIPLFADQHRNAKLVERRGLAIVLYAETFTKAKFIESVHSLLQDDKYRQRAERLSSLMNRKPFKLKERLLSAVEFSAMHGKIEELDVYSYHMGAIQYFCLDVIFAALSLVAISFYAVAYCTSRFLKHILNGKNKID